MFSAQTLSAASCRSSTALSHGVAVERVIDDMRAHVGDSESISLQRMAAIACFSPYAFDRIFRSVTGISPREFLAALRLDMAKRLLLETDRSVIDICYDVGYTSQGTFTRRFTQFVGLAPNRLRQLAREYMISSPAHLWDAYAERHGAASRYTGISGHISATDPFAGLIFVGAFSTRVPQGEPAGCALLTEAGAYHIARVPDGLYYVLAAALPLSANLLDYLLAGPALRIGTSEAPVLVQHGCATEQSNVVLRRPQVTDPPLVVALPLLLAEQVPLDTQVTA